MKERILKKEDFINTIIILPILVLILIFLLSNIIGTTATQIIYGFFFLFCLGIILVRNNLKEKLLNSEKDLQALSDYQKEIEALKITSKFGATIPDLSLILKSRNLSLSETYLEFQSFIYLLNEYLPPVLNENDIKILETTGMHLSENIALFGKKGRIYNQLFLKL